MNRSQLGLTDRERAASGPRSLKKPGSAEWCWQTIDALIAHYRYVEEDFEKVATTLAELAQFEAWKIVPPDQPYGSLDQMLKAEIGIDERTWNRKLRIKRAATNRAANKADEANQRPAGGDRRSERFKVDANQNGVNADRPDGNSRAAALRRLRKDRPDIHARVLAGELTPNAGMIEAGFRKKRPSRKLSALDKIKKLLPLLTEAELNELWKIVGKA